MKKLTLGTAALAAMIAGPAMAADMPAKARPAPPPVIYDWSGIYLGFNAGGMWYDVDRQYPYLGGGFGTGGGVGNHTLSDSDAIYGFHAGFQGQWGNWVLGFEAGAIGCFRECIAQVAVGPGQGFAAGTISQTKITNVFFAGPRLGFAWDRFMIYGTGGYASAALKGEYCGGVAGLCAPAVAPAVFGLNETHHNGWFAGAGIEYMIHKGPLVDVILGAEYLHWDVKARDNLCSNPGCAPHLGGDDTLRATGDIVRGRLTIKTGWGIFGGLGKAPVVAKY